MMAKTMVYQAIVLPTIMYGSETWTWLKKDESGINAVEMRSLRRMCGKRIIDRVRNEQIREECNVRVGVVTKMKVNKLRWFGHVERMSEERLTRKIYVISLPRTCVQNGMNVNEAKEVCRDRGSWRSVLSAYPSWDAA